jgi:hypothetical protein
MKKKNLIQCGKINSFIFLPVHIKYHNDYFKSQLTFHLKSRKMTCGGGLSQQLGVN